ncbi:MAG: xylulokinase [Parvibaculales bacterium]
MTYFLGIDLGASHLKAVLIDAQSQPLAQAAAPIATQQPHIGQAEQNPDDWRNALVQALVAIKAAIGTFDGLAGIAVSGGAHIGVLCAHNARPLRPAILWSDQRAHAEAQQLAQDGKVEKLAYNRPNATWTLPHLIWLQNNEPHHIKNCQKFYFAKDWLRAQLTDDHTSDFGEAVGGMLGDFKTRKWSDTLLNLSGLGGHAVPHLCAPTAQTGSVTAAACAAFGLPKGVPVYQGSIDTSVEFLCCAPLAPQTASLKLASAGVLSFSAKTSTPHPPISLYPHILEGAVYHAAGMNMCMTAIDWVGRTLFAGLTAAQLAEHAASAPPNAHNVLFHPYLAGERAPLWKPDLTAQFSGLSRASNRADIARAAFEGVGHALTEIWHDMTDKLYQPDLLHVMGGGAASDFWCQMLADMLNTPLHRATQTDCSFATALLAGVAHGQFDTFSQAALLATNSQQKQIEFMPDKTRHNDYAEAHKNFIDARFL